MIPLKGHSGCSVVLLEGGIVRKTSPHTDYNSRLLNQSKKQVRFNHPTLKTPQVVESGFTEDGKFFFDMRYVRGRRLPSIFRMERLSLCMKIVDQLATIHKPIGEVDIRPQVSAKLDA